MATTKRFSLGVVLSITTGRLLCPFGDMHECAEWIAGHPIWTHEFADKLRWQSLRDAVLSQHPELSTVDASDVTPDNWQEQLDGWVQTFGATRHLTKGGSVRKESPLESLERIAPGKPVITVEVP